VIFSVKVLMLPMVFCEKVWTPVTIWAAKSAPGRELLLVEMGRFVGKGDEETVDAGR
jgi:hypothetical protein